MENKEEAVSTNDSYKYLGRRGKDLAFFDILQSS